MELKTIEDIRDQDKTMLILIGVPGSGKSTWVESSELDYWIASTDNTISYIADEFQMTYDEAFKDLYPFAENIFWRDITNCLSTSSYPFIVDRTNLSKKSRCRLIQMAKRAGWKVGFVFFQTPEPEIWKERLDGRKDKTIPHDVLKSMAENLKYPEADEGFDFYLEV